MATHFFHSMLVINVNTISHVRILPGYALSKNSNKIPWKMCLFIFMSADYKSVYKCGDNLKSIQRLMRNDEYVKTRNIHFSVSFLYWTPELPEYIYIRNHTLVDRSVGRILQTEYWFNAGIKRVLADAVILFYTLVKKMFGYIKTVHKNKNTQIFETCICVSECCLIYWKNV